MFYVANTPFPALAKFLFFDDKGLSLEIKKQRILITLIQIEPTLDIFKEIEMIHFDLGSDTKF